MIAALLSLVILIWGLYTVGSLYWSATALSTTSDVAAQSAQSAFDRWRFGSSAFAGNASADNANLQLAVSQAQGAADIVLSSLSGQGGAGGLAGIVPDASCGSSSGDYVRRGLTVTPNLGGRQGLTEVAVRVSARWSSGFALAENGGLSVCLDMVSRTSSLREG